MRVVLLGATLVVMLVTTGLPLGAQTREGVMADLMTDIAEVQTKVVGLAKAMPEAAYQWRPADGVRTTGEVFLHVAADNYFMPAAMGIAPPPDTGISGKDFKTAIAFEKRALSRDQVVAELEKSFAFLKTAMAGVPDEKVNAPIEIFGRKSSNRGMWITTTTHLHEHLGQLIAYARSNKVTPPWSK